MTTPASPCVSRCCLTEEKICSGCYRSLSEIMEWSKASNKRKQIIVVNAEQRQHQQN
ncbi:DUF1289 domain-containing protein [Psychromonas algicola]|uniref:DUF1289 domain-containing protein n=1 Tax=Psychromonas algicola TaxID=2555642 RepID=UPI0010688878|nr:DUF1289 domain-containing protein [Psychromonas sp. RZ5]TEW52622.1 DUF1289 domain-containing protein [Psychromonas sp. RZ5]